MNVNQLILFIIISHFEYEFYFIYTNKNYILKPFLSLIFLIIENE